MEVSNLFWNASPEELKNGLVEEQEHYICLLCGKKIEKGIIYPVDGILYEAARYIRMHIDQEHHSVFEHLINLDKKLTGLSEHQNALLRLFHQGMSDSEIQKELKIGSSSTIRNHRFVLREKERQAKVFLVLMELLKDSSNKAPAMVLPHKTAKMVDERYSVTGEQRQKLLKKYFPTGLEGPLQTFQIREKHKLVVLGQIIKRFESKRIYSEKEVNAILAGVYADFATLRRYLIEYGFLDRKADCSEYWVKAEPNEREETGVDRKRELKQQYKEMKKEAGVYQIRNTENGKIFVDATPELKTINGKRFQLGMGNHYNKQLQAEWDQFGEQAFVFEVLEVLEEKPDVFFDKADELKKLEKKWLDKLQPYGERGYNKEKTT